MLRLGAKNRLIFQLNGLAKNKTIIKWYLDKQNEGKKHFGFMLLEVIIISFLLWKFFSLEHAGKV